ncbi:MAG: efflux RND transporter periplasmic adaptor subunit [Microgenomates group bacterium]|nr:efflux RND transporter periplasmic adaptor subunit [Microgenomates group bacterium]
MINFIKKRWYFLIIFLISLFLLKFLISKNAIKDKKTYKVVRKDLKEELSLSGKIEAEEETTLRFQTSGRLAWVGVKEGDYVKKYQVIASLDQRDLKNRLQKYLNTYVKQRLTFEQTKDDYWQKQYDLSQTIRKEAERILEKNQYDLDNTVLDVEYQNLSMEYANLWTPIEGIVIKVDAPFAGVNITPAQAEFVIVNPKTLYFSATADQTEVINLKEGQKGKIVFDSYPDEEVKGEIYWISFAPKTDETGTVYELKTKFNFAKPLKLGMSGDINFITKERKGVIALPSTFIKNDKKGNYVEVQKDKKPVKKYIKRGEEIEGEVIIKEGLEEGEIVIN